MYPYNNCTIMLPGTGTWYRQSRNPLKGNNDCESIHGYSAQLYLIMKHFYPECSLPGWQCTINMACRVSECFDEFEM